MRWWSIPALLVVFLLILAILADSQPSQPSTAPATQPVVPGPLIITQPGIYVGGTYTTVSIRGVSVTLDQMHFTAIGADTISGTGRPSVIVRNCTFDGTPPHYSLVLWGLNSLLIEHCQFNSGGGSVCMDRNGPKSIHFIANKGVNISGVINATSKAKTSFFQVDQSHCPDLVIAYNWSVSQPGIACVEDVISLNRSGGTPASCARIYENLIDGQYAWPRGTQSSGTCVMAYDPADGSNLNEGGYTVVHDNYILNGENVGIDAAGSKFIQIINNLFSAHAISQTGGPARTWNWDLKSSVFGPFITSGNQASWFAGNTQRNFIWALPQTTATNNTYPALTDDQLRALWSARMAAENITVGLVPSASTTMAGTAYTISSPGVQNVPLSKEGLGSPTAAGYIVSGAWLQYPQVDFGAGVTTCTVSLGSPVAGGSFQVHLDSVASPAIATVQIPSTGGWYKYANVTVPAVVAPGIHSVYFTFNGSANINGFSFK